MRLISFWGVQPAPVWLQFQTLPKASKVSGFLNRLQDTGNAIGLGQTLLQGEIDPVHLVIERALEGILTGLARSPDLQGRTRDDLTDWGYSTLSELDEDWRLSSSASDVLRLGYALALAYQHSMQVDSEEEIFLDTHCFKGHICINREGLVRAHRCP